MIVKGNQRGGGLQMAAHLQNTFDNESVEIAELRGAVAPGLAGAFAEWHAQAKATNCKKYLYSLSLNPDPRQGPLTRDQYLDFIGRVEAKLKLSDQPRVVVFHVKDGREHAHIVWSRIDAENSRAVAMSYDHQKLRKVTQEFARDHKLELPASMKENRGDKRYEKQKETVNLHEQQQEDRSGFEKGERLATITAAWTASKSGEDFVRQLAAKDYVLARGDKRGYVVIDLAGEVHSLARQIKGVKTAELKKRLSALPPDKLPSVTDAQAYAQKIREQRQQQLNPGVAPEGPSARERKAALRAAHEAARRPLVAAIDALKMRHARALGKLAVEQAMANAKTAQWRQDFKTKGFGSFLMKLGSLEQVADMVFKRKDKERARTQRAQRVAVQKAHKLERTTAQNELAALIRIQKRERNSLETTIAREVFQKIAAPGQSRAKGGDGKSKLPTKDTPALRPDAALRQPFNIAAKPVAPNAPVSAQRPLSMKERFNQAAAKVEAAGKTTKPISSAAPETSPHEPSLTNTFSAAANPRTSADAEKPDAKTPNEGLADQFNRAAAQRESGRSGPERTFDKNYRKAPAERTLRR
jgi:hypothetical protein